MCSVSFGCLAALAGGLLYHFNSIYYILHKGVNTRMGMCWGGVGLGVVLSCLGMVRRMRKWCFAGCGLLLDGVGLLCGPALRVYMCVWVGTTYVSF